ncbi:MAG: hypothetical protein AAGF95_14835 [Chloroflexota bacterium]
MFNFSRELIIDETGNTYVNEALMAGAMGLLGTGAAYGVSQASGAVGNSVTAGINAATGAVTYGTFDAGRSQQGRIDEGSTTPGNQTGAGGMEKPGS